MLNSPGETTWDDLGDVLVAGQRQLRAQRVDVEACTLLEEERERGQVRRRGQPVEGRRRRGHQHVAVAARHPVERCEPFGDEVLVRREVIVGQRLPVGEQRDREPGGEPGDLVDDPLRRQRVGTEHDDEAPRGRRGRRQLRDRERVGRARQRGGRDALLGGGRRRDERGQRGEAFSACRGGGIGWRSLAQSSTFALALRCSPSGRPVGLTSAAERAGGDAPAAATRGSCASTRAVCSDAKRDYTRGVRAIIGPCPRIVPPRPSPASIPTCC